MGHHSSPWTASWAAETVRRTTAAIDLARLALESYRAAITALRAAWPGLDLAAVSAPILALDQALAATGPDVACAALAVCSVYEQAADESDDRAEAHDWRQAHDMLAARAHLAYPRDVPAPPDPWQL
jgi:hypothetical protein